MYVYNNNNDTTLFIIIKLNMEMKKVILLIDNTKNIFLETFIPLFDEKITIYIVFQFQFTIIIDDTIVIDNKYLLSS